MTEIGNGAFYDCKSLESVVIPGSVTTIGEYAFEGCDNLKEIFIYSTMEQVENRWTTVYGNMDLKSGTLIHCADGDLRVN